MGTHPIFESDFDCLTETGSNLTSHGSYARSRKGYFRFGAPLPPYRPIVAKIHRHRDQRGHSQARQERLQPSLIGVHLRDTHGVGKSHYLTGSKILRVLKSLGAAPELPEDLYFMIKKAVGMRKHLERNRKDRDGKFRLILIESRIHRLSRYYRQKGVLPPNFKYESATASALVA